MPGYSGRHRRISVISGEIERIHKVRKPYKRLLIRPSLDDEELALQDWLGDFDMELEEDLGG